MDLFFEANQNFLLRSYSEIKRNISERSMCSNLKEETSILLRNSKYHMYYVDVEYNRSGEMVKTILNLDKIINITCDFLIHSRGTQEIENILALEMKKSTASQKDKDEDRDRLKALTSSMEMTYKMGGELPLSNVCGYLIGIYYEINSTLNLITLEYYESGKMVYHETNTFEYFMSYTNSTERLNRYYMD